jgi:hypothetical protein
MPKKARPARLLQHLEVGTGFFNLVRDVRQVFEGAAQTVEPRHH